MPSVGERKTGWHGRLAIHMILAVGGLFFLLPLVWMIATSLKPLDQTLQRPEDLQTAFLATGYHATIDGKEFQVTRERVVEPAEQLSIVRPKPTADGKESPSPPVSLPRWVWIGVDQLLSSNPPPRSI